MMRTAIAYLFGTVRAASVNYFRISELLLLLKVIKPTCGACGAVWFGLTASGPPVLCLKSLHAGSSESSERQRCKEKSCKSNQCLMLNKLKPKGNKCATK